jgi:DMSO/TMAO reductase YedYZ molybdopterin-dependent catalytic subunit
MTLAHAMDPGSDVLVAYKQNGQFLHPDHGFPCRMLIPGWIGGRMVKWLSHIEVSERHSDNWYHHHDNKARRRAPCVRNASASQPGSMLRGCAHGLCSTASPALHLLNL